MLRMCDSTVFRLRNSSAAISRVRLAVDHEARDLELALEERRRGRSRPSRVWPRPVAGGGRAGGARARLETRGSSQPHASNVVAARTVPGGALAIARRARTRCPRARARGRPRPVRRPRSASAARRARARWPRCASPACEGDRGGGARPPSRAANGRPRRAARGRGRVAAARASSARSRASRQRVSSSKQPTRQPHGISAKSSAAGSAMTLDGPARVARLARAPARARRTPQSVM